MPGLQLQHASKTIDLNGSLRGLRTAQWQRLRVQGVRKLALLWLRQRRQHDPGGCRFGRRGGRRPFYYRPHGGESHRCRTWQHRGLPQLEENLNQKVASMRDLQPRPLETDAVPLRSLQCRDLQCLRPGGWQPVHPQTQMRTCKLAGAAAAGDVDRCQSSTSTMPSEEAPSG